MRDLIGRTLGHYRIVDKIGEGGMGEVYRAHDERLDRDVAIKVLPASVAQDPERIARFKREAKAVAKLEHPNILTIHDFGTDDGVTYSVTELLEGETLRERLEGGALGWRKAVEIGASIADGLAAAHRAGVVHRDLKPSNVFLTSDRRVKVLDFGLAMVDEGPIEELDTVTSPSPGTLAGTVMGTVGYMAPEQARGDPADSRTDIFALGCVLHEMIAETAPFRRSTAVETMAAILKDEPSDLRTLVADLPSSVAGIIRRCLAKRPEARFQTGQDLAFALRSTIQDDHGPIAQTVSEEKSIVVLPFENLSADPEQEYFSDGLTEEIISDLAKVRAMRVISRTSAMQLKGTKKDLRTIGRELNVRYVLEGSVRRAGDALRITAQLIDAATDTHLWSEKYSGTLDDVFDIQETVSRSIVGALEVELTPQEDMRMTERRTESIRAHECYLRANRDLQMFTESGVHRALRDLQNGLEVMGENADLVYGLGQAYMYAYEFGIDHTGSALRKAEEWGKKLLDLEPDSSRSHYLLGMIERHRGSVLKAVRHFERALVVEPDSRDVLMWLAVCYAWEVGRPPAAIHLAKRLLEIDPLTPFNHSILGFALWMDGKLDDALAAFGKNHELEPESIIPGMWMAFILMWKDHFQDAFDLIENLTQPDYPDQMRRLFSGFLRFSKLAVQRKTDQATATLSDGVKEFAWLDPDLPWMMTGLYSMMDEKEEAYRWLEHAIGKGWINYPLFSELDPFYENLRNDDRFLRLMDQIRPEWEQFEIGVEMSGVQPAGDMK